MGGYLTAMRRYAVFRGRTSRAEFWQFTAVLVGLAALALIIDAAIAREVGADTKEPGGIAFALLLLVHLLPALTVSVRRLHDTDRSGWLVLLNYIPPLNLIVLVFVCLRGTAGPNRYGPDPLDPNALAAGERSGGSPALAGAAPVRPSAGPRRHDVIAELERLGRLRRDGHLSEAEFEVMKAEALAQARG